MASEWLPDGWQWVEVQALCEFIVDCLHETPQVESSYTGYYMIRTSDVQDGRIDISGARFVTRDTYLRRIQRGVPVVGDIIVTREAPLGEVGRVPPDVTLCLGQRLIHYRPDKTKVNPKYLLYAMISPVVRAEFHANKGTGSVVDNLRMNKARTLPIPIPPRNQQDQIGELLSSLDDKIELNQRMNATLEAAARALFKSWFVDFDPVRAKMEGRQPEGMDAATAALFPDRLVESALGEIPAGWRVGTLGEVANNPRRGVQPQSLPEGTFYIGLEHMPQRSISLLDWGVATDVESNKFQFQRGEFLFGKLRPYFHKVGIAPVDGICSTDILVVTPSAIDWWGFVLMTISDASFIDYTTQVSGGTRMPRVNWTDMARYEIVVPTEAVSYRFGEFVQQTGHLMIENIHQSRTLAEARDALLPKLVSGQVRVGEVG